MTGIKPRGKFSTSLLHHFLSSQELRKVPDQQSSYMTITYCFRQRMITAIFFSPPRHKIKSTKEMDTITNQENQGIFPYPYPIVNQVLHFETGIALCYYFQAKSTLVWKKVP